MVDTARTRAALLTLLADNVTGAITAQNIRDWLVTNMPAEFVNPTDFWNEPLPVNMTTDKTCRGNIWYSQTAGSILSAGVIVYKAAGSNVWSVANLAASTTTGILGMVVDSCAAGATSLMVMVEGLWYDSAMSIYSANIGRPFYLCSTTSPGQFSMTRPIGAAGSTISFIVLGYYLSTYCFRFQPGCWSIIS